MSATQASCGRCNQLVSRVETSLAQGTGIG
jgi:hypothetical protein